MQGPSLTLCRQRGAQSCIFSRALEFAYARSLSHIMQAERSSILYLFLWSSHMQGPSLILCRQRGAQSCIFSRALEFAYARSISHIMQAERSSILYLFQSFGVRICKVHLSYYAGSCLLYTSPSPRDKRQSRMPSSA